LVRKTASRPSLAGQLVSLGAGDPLDEALAAQAPQVVGHLSGAVAGDQPGDQLAQTAVRQACEQVVEGAQAGEQRHRARLAEAQAGGG
jgi:hypothetical protein